MFKHPEHSIVESARRGWSFYGAFSASTVVHLVVMLVCAWWMVQPETPFVTSDFEVRWAGDEKADLAVEPLNLKSREFDLQTDAGSSPSTSIFIKDRPVKLDRVAEPVLPVLITRAPAENTDLVSGLADKVDISNSSGDGGMGEGTGSGNGNGGGGSAAGFFGMRAKAKNVIFVVDCSGSMNKQHLSEWKTRFRLLKYEIVKSVTAMSIDQRFYIIFFSNKTYRMPAFTLQHATRSAKLKYLKWMAKQKAVGETDPRGALRYALRLQPDIIYFLTDGAFIVKIRRELLTIRQNKTKIHTFVFGNKKGESVMKQIAKQNGGKFQFIP